MADISLRNKVLPWERNWEPVSLVHSWDTWKNFFADYEHSTPMLCRRYIVDIVGAASCPEEEL